VVIFGDLKLLCWYFLEFKKRKRKGICVIKNFISSPKYFLTKWQEFSFTKITQVDFFFKF
jgi:hypothetical protein